MGARWQLAAILLFVALVLVSPSARGAEKMLRFDCGTADSPVMAGYQRLTAADLYSSERGYGWEAKGASSVEFEKPGPPLKAHWVQKGAFFEESVTPLTGDAVVSKEDLVFRANVPNGAYRVDLIIGDMTQSIGSIDVYVNGELAEAHVGAWYNGDYRMFLSDPLGWWTTVRKTARVTDGSVLIKLTGNQTYYDEQLAEHKKMENPYKKYWWSYASDDMSPYYYIGWPFVHNSLMAIEISPLVLPLVTADVDRLSVASEIKSPALQSAVSAFNAGDFPASLQALSKVAEPDAQVAKALVQLCLAGRLEVEQDRKLVPQAINVLQPYLSSHPEATCIGEILDDAKIFSKGVEMFLTRGQLGKKSYLEINKAVAWLWLIKENSPLYYKAQLYIARALHMHLPYVPTLGTEAEILKNLAKKFPDNRHVKYLLHWQWAPYGDGTGSEDWYMNDYSSKVAGAPDWVGELYPSFGHLLDWTEWFMKFRQTPEGSIGGGLSDDVEIVGAFGYVGFVNREVGRIPLDGARKLCEGNWKYGSIDDEVGYYLPFADAEHTAEPTGDTLAMMVRIDYGDPLWIERSMKTGKLMRDLWTDIDNNGHRHFRSNCFNAVRIGTGNELNDSWINYRAVTPADAVLWYNQNPAVSKVLVELADGWLAAAMSTARGKPMGVIPAQVSFPDGIIGGTNSPNWYTADHGQGAIRNYDWGKDSVGYKSYMHDLLLTAYAQTGDRKYLEPLRLEYELAARYGKAPEAAGSTRLQEIGPHGPDAESVFQHWPRLSEAFEKRQAKQPQQGTAPQAAAQEAAPEPGSEKWVAQEMGSTAAWLTAQRLLQGRQGPLVDEITQEDIILYSGFTDRMLKFRWPLMTTEAHATDRAVFGGIMNPFFVYSGGRFIGRFLTFAITYENTTKDFAAAVMATDPQGFRIMYYSLAPDVREVGIIPWDLEPGGKYKLRYGTDEDGDGKFDTLAGERDLLWPQRGTPITVTIRPRRTYIIDVDQLQRGKGAVAAPDPGLSENDIRHDAITHNLMARIHNVGSKAVRNVKVVAYDGDPQAGGTQIGTATIPNIEAPNDLEPRTVTAGFAWDPTKDSHDIYIVVDPDDEIKDEITTFNNVAHKLLPEKAAEAPAAKPAAVDILHTGGR